MSVPPELQPIADWPYRPKPGAAGVLGVIGGGLLGGGLFMVADGASEGWLVVAGAAFVLAIAAWVVFLLVRRRSDRLVLLADGLQHPDALHAVRRRELTDLTLHTNQGGMILRFQAGGQTLQIASAWLPDGAFEQTMAHLVGPDWFERMVG